VIPFKEKLDYPRLQQLLETAVDEEFNLRKPPSTNDFQI
jgi:hypothetical protein